MRYEKILEVVPIRKPVLCIDDICEIEYGKYVTGYRKIEKKEEWAKGHFVEEPIFPGTMIIETMGQIGAFIFYEEGKTTSLKSYLVKVNNIKFNKKVVPDCKLYIRAELVSKLDRLVQIYCKATVDGKTVATGELTLYFIEDDLSH